MACYLPGVIRESPERQRKLLDLRTGAAVTVLALLFIGGFRIAYVQAFFVDRREMGARFQRIPDFTAQGYPRFLRQVKEATAPGDSIAIVVPMKSWHHGYSYAYYRATYLLGDRRVLPLMNDQDSWTPEVLRHAEYVAAWRETPTIPGFRLVRTTDEGAIYRRTR
ncbi:MAG: hypothetical protein WBX15_06955 [Thermoanaerobaculia bacterium]